MSQPLKKIKKLKEKAEDRKIENLGKQKELRNNGPSIEDTLKRAAEEEAERQRIEAEEAKTSAQKDEEQKMKQGNLGLLDEAEMQQDVIKWVNSVPLSQSCIKRIDRAFSDGSLIAELIHHFCPHICNNRQYFRWHSKVNKISNWESLNFRVFPKLGFRLNQKQIDNLLCPFACGKFQKNCEKGLFVFKLLARIRKELGKRNAAVFEDRKSTSAAPVSSCKKKPFINKYRFLDHPPFSKIEMLIEQGYYDKDMKNNDEEETDEFSECSCHSESEAGFRTFFPCNFTASGSQGFELEEIEASCHQMCIQPSLCFTCVQPATSCYLY